MILSLSGIITIDKLNKCKPTRFPCVIVLGKIYIPNYTKSFKWNSKFFRPAIQRDVSN